MSTLNHPPLLSILLILTCPLHQLPFSVEMAHLYRNIRIHQVFGANTGVGKTIVSTALALSSALSGKLVEYVKPVSTGPANEADER